MKSLLTNLDQFIEEANSATNQAHDLHTIEQI
jgi:hypothetical protein